MRSKVRQVACKQGTADTENLSFVHYYWIRNLASDASKDQHSGFRQIQATDVEGQKKTAFPSCETSKTWICSWKMCALAN
jgi:hypothetical protein